MRERYFGSVARWAAVTVAATTAAFWGLNPPETLASIQLKQLRAQGQVLSGQLYQEGALDVRLVLSPLLLPAWDTQIVDASNPKMPQLAEFIKQDRVLSQKVSTEQQWPLRNIATLLGAVLAAGGLANTVIAFSKANRR